MMSNEPTRKWDWGEKRFLKEVKRVLYAKGMLRWLEASIKPAPVRRVGDPPYVVDVERLCSVVIRALLLALASRLSRCERVRLPGIGKFFPRYRPEHEFSSNLPQFKGNQYKVDERYDLIFRPSPLFSRFYKHEILVPGGPLDEIFEIKEIELEVYGDDIDW